MNRWIKIAWVALSICIVSQVAAQENYHALNITLNLGEVSAIGANFEIDVAQQITVAPTVLIDFEGDFGLGARGFYYFDQLFGLTNPWDVYSGLELGYRFESSQLNLGIFIGGEWHINDQIGLLLEFSGGSISFGGGAGIAIHI